MTIIGPVVLAINICIALAILIGRHMQWTNKWTKLNTSLANVEVRGEPLLRREVISALFAVKNALGRDIPEIRIDLTKEHNVFFAQTKIVRKYWWSKPVYLIEVYEQGAVSALVAHEICQHVMAFEIYGHGNFAHNVDDLTRLELKALLDSPIGAL